MTEFVLEIGKYRGPELQPINRCAVLIVDMTNDFAHPNGVYPRNGAACPSFADIVPNVRSILECAHDAGVLTIATNQVIYADRQGRAVGAGNLLAARPWLEHEGLRPGTWGTQVIDDLPPVDLTIHKPRASAFFGTPVDTLLRASKIDTVIIVGCYTNQCVVATARDGVAHDYQTVLVTDGVTAFDEHPHCATLESLKPLTIQLTADETVSLIRQIRQTAP